MVISHNCGFRVTVHSQAKDMMTREKTVLAVIPAQTGIQGGRGTFPDNQSFLDSRLRGNDSEGRERLRFRVGFHTRSHIEDDVAYQGRFEKS